MFEENASHKDDNDIKQEEKDNKSDYIDNLLLLKEFDDKGILDCLENRFKENDIIYSYIGHSILISLNPQKELGIYSEKTRNIYKKYFNDMKYDPSTHEPPAHLYYLVEDSYKDMIENQKDQTFIISGDSGSGKTESAKYIINYLINSSKGEINNYIMDGNEILESFGNAKTEKNDNSSRFGKLISINFSKEGKILNAHFETYLLEKSRLVKIAQNERNYHVFYQLILGSSEEEKKKYNLQNLEYYNYLNNKKEDELTNDKILFNNLKNKLKTFEIDVDNLFKIISGILYLGNIQFEEPNKGKVFIKKSSQKDLEQASNLFGLKKEELVEILTTFTYVANKKVESRTAKKGEPEMVRDYISKELYSQLFDFIIKKINDKMKNNKEAKSFRICILDIFGFENLQNNSFEQLCINYTNERLQKYFSNHVIKLEQELYIKEGLDYEKIKYKDNKDIIRLIDGDKKKEILELIENNNNNNDEILKLIDKDDKNYKKINDLLKNNNQNIEEIIKKSKDKKFRDKIKKSIDENNKTIIESINENSNKEKINELIKEISSNNERIIKLTELTYSIIKFLNDNYQAVKNEDESFRNKVYENLSKSFEGILLKDKIEDKNAFIIKHYAAKIKYNIKNIIIKNKSNFSEHEIETIEKVFKKSNNGLIKELFNDDKNKIKNISLFTYFKQQLDELFEIFTKSNNKYIKCIKTKNKEVKEKHFDPDLVLEQMNYGGILEAIKIKKQGYSIRKSKEEFFEEYSLLFPKIIDRVFNDEIINKMVESIKEFDDKKNPCKNSNIDLIKVGKENYIFMNEDLKRFLDIIKNKYLMINKISNLIIIKKKLKAFVQIKIYVNYVKLIKMRHYIIIDWLKKKKKYENLKKQSAIKIECYFRRYLSINKYKKKKKRKNSAIKIECYFRAYISRKKYKQLKIEKEERERKIREERKKKEEKERKEREEKEKEEKEKIKSETNSKIILSLPKQLFSNNKNKNKKLQIGFEKLYDIYINVLKNYINEKNRNKSLDLEINELKNENKSLDFQLKNKNASLDLEINELKNKNTNLDLEINEFKNKNTGLNLEIEELKNENKSLNLQLTNNNTNLDLEINELKNKNISLNLEIEELKNENKSLNLQLKNNNTNLDLEISQLRNKKESLDSLVNELKNKNSSLILQINELNNKNMNLELEKNELKYKNTSSDTLVNDLKTKNASLDLQINELNNKNTSLDLEINELKIQNTCLYSLINELKRKNTSLNLQLNDLNNKNTNFNLSINELNNKNTSLNLQLKELNDKNASLSLQLKELNTLKTSLDLKINELNNKVTSLNSQIVELKNENKILEENLKKELEEKKRSNNNGGQGTIYDQFVNENLEEDDFNYDIHRRRLYTGGSKGHMQTISDRPSNRQAPNNARNEICQKNKPQKAKASNNSTLNKNPNK